MENLKLIALDIDGVALNDTFSPIIHSLVKKWGGDYTREVERNVFSQKREDAAAYLKQQFHLTLENQEILALYFRERAEFIKQNPIKPVNGLLKFLKMCQGLNLKIICYGGLDYNHFEHELGEYTQYFDAEKYICTNDFRPGIKEITKNFYNLDYKNVLFIDDVNKVAEEARFLNAGFIGIPSDFKHGFQKEEMLRTGVKYIVSELEKIDKNLVEQIDSDLSENKLWI